MGNETRVDRAAAEDAEGLFEVLRSDPLEMALGVMGLANSCSCGNSGGSKPTTETTEPAGIRIAPQVPQDIPDFKPRSTKD